QRPLSKVQAQGTSKGESAPLFDQGPRKGIQSTVIGLDPEIITATKYLLLTVPVKVLHKKGRDGGHLKFVEEWDELKASALVSKISGFQGVYLEQFGRFQHIPSEHFLHGLSGKGFVAGVFFLQKDQLLDKSVQVFQGVVLSVLFHGGDRFGLSVVVKVIEVQLHRIFLGGLELGVGPPISQKVVQIPIPVDIEGRYALPEAL